MDRCLFAAQNKHSHQTEVYPLCVGKYQTIAHLSRSLQIKIGLGPRTEVCVPSTCSHRSDPCLLPFCRFPLRGMYSPSIQVVSRILSTCNHRFVPRSLHPHGHRKIHSSCSHDHRFDPCQPWDGYKPFLGCSTSRIDGRETPLLSIILMFDGSASSWGDMGMDLTFPPF